MTKIIRIEEEHTSEAVTFEAHSNCLLLLDLDGNIVTTLIDNGFPTQPIIGQGPLARKLWAARLRYWAEQFEKEVDDA